jgi:hypothetical protein
VWFVMYRYCIDIGQSKWKTFCDTINQKVIELWKNVVSDKLRAKWIDYGDLMTSKSHADLKSRKGTMNGRRAYFCSMRIYHRNELI